MPIAEEKDKATKMTIGIKEIDGNKYMEFSVPLEYWTGIEFGGQIVVGAMDQFKTMAQQQFMNIVKKKQQGSGIITPHMKVQ